MNILICDDDRMILSSLYSELSQKLDSRYNLHCVSTAEEIKEKILSDNADCKRFDIAILDIKLQEDNGIDYAFLLEQKYPDIKTIFISGYDDYYEAMFMKVKPFAFLHKPINIDILLFHIKTISDITDENKKGNFIINSKKLKTEIPYNHIILLESFKRIVVVHCLDNDIEIYAKLNDIAKNLPKNFVRTHQSYIVNLNYIKDTDLESNIKLNGNKTAKISRPYKKDFLKKYYMTKGGIL